MAPALQQPSKLVRVLTVGEGDLSFSRALKRRFGDAIQLTATTLLQRDELTERYRSAAGVIEELVQAGVTICHGVDACRLQVAGLEAVQDIVIFNYPHLGEAPGDSHSPDSEHVRRHCSLLAHFLASARQLLSPRGQIHVTLCGEQPALWQLRRAASRSGLALLQSRPPTDAASFAVGSLAELLPPPASAPPSSWSARRKWRNGSLGCVHWASPYGYEHRRHESEQTMSTDSSLAFVFEAASGQDEDLLPPAAEAPAGVAGGGLPCRVCGRLFASEAELSAHHLAPAVPVEPASSSSCGHTCERCGRWFSSERALQQHQSAAKCGGLVAARGGPSAAMRSPAAGPPDPGGRAVLKAEATVTEESAGSRFLQHARQHAFRDLLTSKAIARRALDSGELTLNGELVEETRRLCAGDVLRLELNRARSEREAALAQARHVRVVATSEGVPLCAGLGGEEAEEAAGWRAVAWRCPPGAAVVWKPAGMRSLGEHAGTLQSALPLLSALAGAERPRPLSRLEIGCAGLSLVALSPAAHEALSGLVAAGCVAHHFVAVVRGRLGVAEECVTLRLPRRGPGEADQEAADEEVQEQEEHEVTCRVLHVAERDVRAADASKAAVSAAATSVVELSTTACAGRCCGLLCLMLRLNGTPVVGDRLARRRAAAAAAEGGEAGGAGAGAERERKLRLECTGITIQEEDAGDLGPLDVRICRKEALPR